MAPSTLKDVATRAGVSTATASRALNNRGEVSDETRRRVKRIADELGYQPNTAARGLWSGRTKKVGIVVTTVLSPFYATMVDAIETVLKPEGFNIVLCSSHEDPALESEAIQLLLQQRVDGLIITPVKDNPETVRYVAKNSVPFVLAGRSIRGLAADFVGCDDLAIGRMAATHLIEQGHRRILFLNSDQNSSAILRLEGYKQALREAGLPFDAELVYPLGPRASLEKVLARALKLRPRPTAMFCFCDEIALGALAWLKESGLRVPDDMAIASCDNVRYASQLNPSLTSVDTQTVEMGKAAAQVLVSRIKGYTGEPIRRTTTPTLVRRESS